MWAGDTPGEYLQTRFHDTVVSIPNFTSSGCWAIGGYQIIPKKLELVAKWEYFDPEQLHSDDLRTVTGALNWYIKGRDIALMLDHMHTWSHFREAHPSFGPDQFDEITTRAQFSF